MDGVLARAIEIAEERKVAVTGFSPGLVHANEDQVRRLLSGCDLDFAEFDVISQRAGFFFARSTMGAVYLPEACRAAWADGLLVGTILARLSD